MAKLGLTGRVGLATTSDLADYDLKKSHLDQELQRRRNLGAQMEDVGVRERHLLDDDFASRRRHRVEFAADTATVLRLLATRKDALLRGKAFDSNRHTTAMARVALISERLHSSCDQECSRIGTHRLVSASKAAGAVLLDPSTNQPAAEADLFGDACPRLWRQHPVHGLKVPASGTSILLVGGVVVGSPPDSFVHPDTGRVLPINGNVCYDGDKGTLVITVDALSG